MLRSEQYEEIWSVWEQNAHFMGFAVSDDLSFEASTRGYARAMGWE